MQKSIQELSIDSKLIYDRLKTVPKGKMVSYKELSKIIDRNIQKEGRGYLKTAIEIARREDNLVFASVWNKGVKCLTDEENAMTTGEATIKRIRSAASKGIKKLIAVKDFDSMPNDAKIKHNMGLSILGAFLQATKSKKIAHIENVLSQNNERLSTNKTLELFK